MTISVYRMYTEYTTLKSRQACAESSDVQQRFERCKELTLGVDLDAFGGDGDREDVAGEGDVEDV